MRFLVVALLLSSIIGISLCAGQKDQLKKDAYVQHERMLKGFPCSKPQPRVMELRDVMNEDMIKHLNDKNERSSIRPAVTVLYRCESTGCCRKPTERCMPIETEDVTLTFAVTGNSLHFLKVKAENHVTCACMRL